MDTVYFQETVTSHLSQETVDIETRLLIEKLLEKGYIKFKVTVFPPFVEFPNLGSVRYSTSVQASRYPNIEFG